MIEFLKQNSAVLFYLAGIAGMLAHYTKKWSRGQYFGNLWAYMFADNPRASLAALITYSAAAAAVVATGTIATMDLPALIALGFMTGYTSDSVVNKT